MDYVRKAVFNKIDDWYSGNPNVGLLITGLPKVGKTYAIKKWLSLKGYSNTFFSEPDYLKIKDVFNDSYLDTDIKIINALFFNKSLGEILIFDGVEPNDSILSMIKQICSENKHRYIFISRFGNYLFKEMSFIPVGYLQIIDIKPLTFNELLVNKFSPFVIKTIKTNESNKSFSIPNFGPLSEMWNIYTKYGGFPCVLDAFFLKGINAANRELLEIKNLLIDLVKSLKYNKQMIELLNSYSKQRSSIYKSFLMTEIKKGATFARYEKSINTLLDIGLFSIIKYKDLLTKQKKSNFDFFIVDPGLEMVFSNFNNEPCYRSHIISGIFFNFLLKNNNFPYRLVYKDGLVDFIIDNPLTMFEIKLSNAGFRSNTMNRLLVDKYYGISAKYILLDKGKDVIFRERNLTICPLWYYLVKYENEE